MHKYSEFGYAVRSQFPIFSGAEQPALAYLDTAASSQKPACVIDRIQNYLSFEHANIHRGAYRLSGDATQNYEAARSRLASYVGLSDSRCLIFTRGATESINLAAHALEEEFKAGDCILLSILEHHSNIVPWQLLAKRKNLKIEFVDCSLDGVLDLEDLKVKLKTLKPKLLALTHVSNALGTLVPVKTITAITKEQGVLFLLDAAQSVVHKRLDFTDLGVDLMAFSGHKMYGPTGIGALCVNPNLIDRLQPFQGGGDMIETVTVDGSTWAAAPQKFEAGTPAIAEALGLGAAVEFLEALDRTALAEHERKIFDYAWEKLSGLPGVSCLGPRNAGAEQESIISFEVAGIHPHDLATVADSLNVQFRAGHHCAMPLMKRLNKTATARISFGMYSDLQDIDQLLGALARAKQLFKV